MPVAAPIGCGTIAPASRGTNAERHRHSPIARSNGDAAKIVAILND
jgi:hypothetical protein